MLHLQQGRNSHRRILVDSEYLKSLTKQQPTHKVAMIFHHIRLHYPEEKRAGGHFRVKELHVKYIMYTPHRFHPKKLQDI